MKRYVAAVCVLAFSFSAAQACSGTGAKVKAGNFGPVASTYNAQNSPQDRLVVQITPAVQEGDKWVSQIKVVWGDLDNLIPRCSSAYYSNWDGSVKLTGATGEVIRKIQFEDGWQTRTPKRPGRTPLGPRIGSGADQLLVGSGAEITWKAAVVGVLDGLIIKVTSDSPTAGGTLTAGPFTYSFDIAPAAATGTQVQVQTTGVNVASGASSPAASQVQVQPVNVTAQPSAGSTTASPAAGGTSGSVSGVGIRQME